MIFSITFYSPDARKGSTLGAMQHWPERVVTNYADDRSPIIACGIEDALFGSARNTSVEAELASGTAKIARKGSARA